MKIIYATDLHGNRRALEELFAAAKAEGVGAVVIGGDLTPKLCAVQLARYDTEDDDLEERDDCEGGRSGGEVIPTDLLRIEQNGVSCLSVLSAIRERNQSEGREGLAEKFEQRGYFIHRVDNRFYNLGDMISEQEVVEFLRKLSKFTARGGEKPAELNDYQLSLLLESVPWWFREYESTFSEKDRREFTQYCGRKLQARHLDFEDVAISRMLEPYVLACQEPNREFRTEEAVRAVAGMIDGPLQTYVERQVGLLGQRLKWARQYGRVITKGMLRHAVEFSTIMKLKRIVESEESVRAGQADFLSNFFLPLVQSWRNSGGSAVYTMLGNDDLMANAALLEDADTAGLLYYLHGRIANLPDGTPVVGYSYVGSLPSGVAYQAWVREEDDIEANLTALRQKAGERALWVIHSPPYKCLDQADKGEHAGSRGVRRFIERAKPRLALFGHIHEAARLEKRTTAVLGETLCVNPGAEHEDGVQAVVIDTEGLVVARPMARGG